MPVLSVSVPGATHLVDPLHVGECKLVGKLAGRAYRLPTDFHVEIGQLQRGVCARQMAAWECTIRSQIEATKENKLVLHTDTHTRTHAQKNSQGAHLCVSAGNTAQLVHVHAHVAAKA